MRFSLEEFIEHAQSSTTNPKAVSVLVKEFLHYDILNALSQSGMANELVFQGGTALRVCHNGERLSEDLDFVCGPAHEEFNTANFVKLLKENVSDRYGVLLETIKSPERDLSNPEHIDVKFWEFKLKFQSLGRAELIRLEVCNVPAYDANFELVTPRHELLAKTMPSFMLRAESMDEILADKLKALGSRKFLKARDIWDLKFLAAQGVQPDYLMVAQKVADYRNTDAEFMERVGLTIGLLRASDAREKFCTEMTRFVDVGLAKMMESNPAVADSWIKHALREMTKLEEAYPEAARQRDAGAFLERVNQGIYTPAFEMAYA
ncbi:nucleotidyl transferase AbiEii/AbiGii toxin family protein [Geopseudomonas aromaticivorans]